MEAPHKIEPKDLADYLAVITQAVFQSGISWRVIEAKWDGFVAAFHGFDPRKVADLTPDDVDRLAEDTRIVRNRSKIEATIQNAQTLLELDARPGGFTGYLGSHSGTPRVPRRPSFLEACYLLISAGCRDRASAPALLV